jgi:hypothetical protein
MRSSHYFFEIYFFLAAFLLWIIQGTAFQRNSISFMDHSRWHSQLWTDIIRNQNEKEVENEKKKVLLKKEEIKLLEMKEMEEQKLKMKKREDRQREISCSLLSTISSPDSISPLKLPQIKF